VCVRDGNANSRRIRGPRTRQAPFSRAVFGLLCFFSPSFEMKSGWASLTPRVPRVGSRLRVSSRTLVRGRRSGADRGRVTVQGRVFPSPLFSQRDVSVNTTGDGAHEARVLHEFLGPGSRVRDRAGWARAFAQRQRAPVFLGFAFWVSQVAAAVHDAEVPEHPRDPIVC
jgi:hypothetical protein